MKRPQRQRRATSIRSAAMRYVSLAILLIAFLGPFWWMTASAFKPRTEIFAHGGQLSFRSLIPQEPTVDNFTSLVANTNFVRAFFNSAVVSLATVALSVLICSMVAFGLVITRFRGRRVVFAVILSTMLIPFEAILVPLTLVVRGLGLFDSYAALVMPWIADAFIIFLLRQHFLELPREIEDAAKIDGAGPLALYFRIMLPNIKPALVSAAFIKFLFSWDQYIWPLVATQSRDLEVVNLALGRLFTSEGVAWELVFAGSVLATLPVVGVFALLQRYYVAGLAHSGVKG